MMVVEKTCRESRKLPGVDGDLQPAAEMILLGAKCGPRKESSVQKERSKRQ